MTHALIEVQDEIERFGLLRPGLGMPDGERGVLHALRPCLAYARPQAFTARAMHHAMEWAMRDPQVLVLDRPQDRPLALFRYRVMRSRGTPDAVYVAVEGRTMPGCGGEPWVPLAAFLVFATRLRIVSLPKADQAVRDACLSYPDCVAAVERAAAGAPPMLGDDMPLAEMPQAADVMHRLGCWVRSSDALGSAGPGVSAALEERAAAAMRRAVG